MKKRFLNIIILFILMFICNYSKAYAVSDALVTKYNNLNTNVNNMNKTAFLSSHPVGSIYITTSSAENTAAKMKSKYGGTWEVYSAGRTLYGYNSSDTDFSTVGNTGGIKSTTLAIENLPSHNHSISHTHTINAYSVSSGSHTHTTIANTLSVSLSTPSEDAHTHGLSEGSISGGGIFMIDTSSTHDGMPYANGFVTSSTQGFWPGENKGLASLNSSGNHSHTVTGTITIPALTVPSGGAHTHTVPSLSTGNPSSTNSGSKGSGEVFTNLEPFITVYMYRRTS